MDRKALIKNLKSIFCDYVKEDKRYSEIWLTDADFGGLYHSGNFILNLKMEKGYEIYSCGEEIDSILQMLDKEAKEELQYIWRVDIYDSDEQIHCQSDECLVYEIENACP